MSDNAITCPRCDRVIRHNCGRFQTHSITPRGFDTCPMSDQHIPVTGTTPTDYVSRAHMVADLAAQVQDADPAIVWEILTAMPATELQRMMMLALAAIPIDQTVGEMFSWVCELPAAKVVSIA